MSILNCMTVKDLKKAIPGKSDKSKEEKDKDKPKKEK